MGSSQIQRFYFIHIDCDVWEWHFVQLQSHIPVAFVIWIGNTYFCAYLRRISQCFVRAVCVCVFFFATPFRIRSTLCFILFWIVILSMFANFLCPQFFQRQWEHEEEEKFVSSLSLALFVSKQFTVDMNYSNLNHKCYISFYLFISLLKYHIQPI